MRRAYFRMQVKAVADWVLGQGIANNREVMMIDRLELKNFTSFGDLDIDFSSKINVIIGENGTGKTQLLKALYFANKSLALQDATSEEMLRLYRPLSNSLKGLVGDDGKSKAELSCQLANGQVLHVNFSANSKHLAKERFVSTPVVGEPSFIPVKEVLSLMKGILASKGNSETLQALFDQSYLDIAKKLEKSPPSNQKTKSTKTRDLVRSTLNSLSYLVDDLTFRNFPERWPLRFKLDIMKESRIKKVKTITS